MTYESLIFDIDGTLWDSRALVAEGYNIQLRREGLDHLAVTAEALKPLFGKVKEEIADALFPSVPRQERYALMDRCMESERVHMRQNPCRVGYPRVRETLEALSRKHRIFIVSNGEKGYPQLCIEKLGLGEIVRGHLCYGDTGTPKGKTIRTLMDAQKIHSCAYIGDTQGDLEACREAGVPFIYAAYGFGQPESWDARIESVESLLLL